MVDETTDRSTSKQLVILARIVDDATVTTKFIDMPVCQGGSAQELFNTIDACLR